MPGSTFQTIDACIECVLKRRFRVSGLTPACHCQWEVDVTSAFSLACSISMILSPKKKNIYMRTYTRKHAQYLEPKWLRYPKGSMPLAVIFTRGL